MPVPIGWRHGAGAQLAVRRGEIDLVARDRVRVDVAAVFARRGSLELDVLEDAS